MTRKRVTIEIENDYVEEIMRRYQLRTKTEALDYALRRLALMPLTREEALSLEGAHLIDHVPEDSQPTEF